MRLNISDNKFGFSFHSFVYPALIKRMSAKGYSNSQCVYSIHIHRSFPISHKFIIKDLVFEVTHECNERFPTKSKSTEYVLVKQCIIL